MFAVLALASAVCYGAADFLGGLTAKRASTLPIVVLDMLANLLYLIATRTGPLSVVVTLASLYPASTVLLARVVLHERLSPRQWVGIACVLVAVIAIVR